MLLHGREEGVFAKLGLQALPSMKLECITEHCLAPAVECVANSDCRSAAICASKCFLSVWDKDTTPEKVHVQNCTNKCAFTYRGKVYESFMSCVSSHKCIGFPPIPSQCRGPSNVSVLKKLSTRDLEGFWWVVKGFHPVYDCYPCQHLLFKPVNSTSWSYTPKYQVYLENGSLVLIDDEYIIPNTTSPGSNISFAYYDVGLVHYETWWLIDGADDLSYILLYYCGNTLQWYYDGALVFSRKTSLQDSDYAKIAASYSKATGLDFTNFCNVSTAPCPD